jgi:two-component system CheB/CheR fusion protein
VTVTIRDSGIGIPPDFLPRVFDLFVQGERGLDRTEGGFGIGLTLVRSLVGMHGGTVTARSAGPGLGSEFVVSLPAAAKGSSEAA